MSGGSYDYFYRRVADVADQIREHGGCGREYSRPALRRAFREHLHKVAAALRAIEWNDSCDGDETEIAKLEELLGPGAELREAIAGADRARSELGAAITAATGVLNALEPERPTLDEDEDDTHALGGEA